MYLLANGIFVFINEKDPACIKMSDPLFKLTKWTFLVLNRRGPSGGEGRGVGVGVVGRVVHKKDNLL